MSNRAPEYALESEMVAQLVKELPTILVPSLRTCSVACEVAHGSRVIDVLLSQALDPADVIADWGRYERALRSLSSQQTYVLSMIWSRGAVGAADLGRDAFVEQNALETKYLTPLEAKGLIRRSIQGTLRPTEWAHWRPSRLVAIEAKLSDWRGALVQALDNTRRTDYSYVAFPTNFVSTRPHVVDSARAAGIGVLAVPIHGAPRVLVKARRVSRTDSPEFWDLSLRLLSARQPRHRSAG